MGCKQDEQRDLKVLWAYDLQTVQDTSFNPAAEAYATICRFTMVPLCYLDLFVDPT